MYDYDINDFIFQKDTGNIYLPVFYYSGISEDEMYMPEQFAKVFTQTLSDKIHVMCAASNFLAPDVLLSPKTSNLIVNYIPDLSVANRMFFDNGTNRRYAIIRANSMIWFMVYNRLIDDENTYFLSLDLLCHSNLKDMDVYNKLFISSAKYTDLRTVLIHQSNEKKNLLLRMGQIFSHIVEVYIEYEYIMRFHQSDLGRLDNV